MHSFVRRKISIVRFGTSVDSRRRARTRVRGPPNPRVTRRRARRKRRRSEGVTVHEARLGVGSLRGSARGPGDSRGAGALRPAVEDDVRVVGNTATGRTSVRIHQTRGAAPRASLGGNSVLRAGLVVPGTAGPTSLRRWRLEEAPQCASGGFLRGIVRTASAAGAPQRGQPLVARHDARERREDGVHARVVAPLVQVSTQVRQHRHLEILVDGVDGGLA